MIISKVSLEDMLRCREQRAAKQRELIERHGLPVACFTMNIPGEIKRTPLIEFAFLEGVKRFEAALPAAAAREFTTSFTGCEAFFVFDERAETVKTAAVETEESAEVARLYDIDVIDVTDEKLSRAAERRCVVCGGPVAACARSRAHGLDETLVRMDALLCDFAAKRLAALAYGALITEVNATPKPGLVDKRNSGAHRDMDIASFYRSAGAIEPYFERMALTVLTARDTAPEPLMKELRALGLEAERAMLGATGGVNTHKGAIFSMGLLIAGACAYLRTGRAALPEASRFASLGMEGALRAAKAFPATNGERVFVATGATGARGEAAAGFPAALAARDALDAFIGQGYSAEDAAALTLPVVMERLADTNLVHRGGEAGLAFARQSAARINALPVGERLDALHRLDDVFIERNLSPGGCADVLSLALLMRALGAYIEL
jgi:holo-ACP synthase/triphosphoribosyl-dephospho-CoA synthase